MPLCMRSTVLHYFLYYSAGNSMCCVRPCYCHWQLTCASRAVLLAPNALQRKSESQHRALTTANNRFYCLLFITIANTRQSPAGSAHALCDRFRSGGRVGMKRPKMLEKRVLLLLLGLVGAQCFPMYLHGHSKASSCYDHPTKPIAGHLPPVNDP